MISNIILIPVFSLLKILKFIGCLKGLTAPFWNKSEVNLYREEHFKVIAPALSPSGWDMIKWNSMSLLSKCLFSSESQKKITKHL
jgi:hypothetical protein